MKKITTLNLLGISAYKKNQVETIQVLSFSDIVE